MLDGNTTTRELVGWFWSPEEPSKKLPGRLSTEPGGEMRLEVINHVDTLSDEPATARMALMPFHGVPIPWYLGGSHSRLVGVVSGETVSARSVSDTAITLDDCHLLTSGWIQQPTHIAFIVNRAYIGVALGTTEALQCNRATWIADGIEGWLNPGGPDVDLHKSAKALPSVGTAAEIDGLGRAQLRMGLMGRFSRKTGNTYEIAESGYASLKPEHAAPWERMIDAVAHVHRFLRFALDRLCCIKQLIIETDGLSVEVVEQRMRGAGQRTYRPDQVRFDALFTAHPTEAGVVGDAEAVLRRWLEIPREAQGTLFRLDGLMDSSEFVDTQAVSACGAGELWYSQVLEATDEPFEPLSLAAQDDIRRALERHGRGEVYSGSIHRILTERSTGARVRGAFDPIEREVMDLTPSQKCRVSRRLLSMRHPWSHGGVVLDDRVATLAEVVKKARAILKLRVLQYLGVDWRTVAKYNKTIRWELGVDGWHSVPYPIYRGDETLDACLKYLRRAGGRRRLQEITDALAGGGWKNHSKNPSRVVSHTLTAYLKEGGCVERVRSRGKVLWRVSEGWRA